METGGVDDHRLVTGAGNGRSGKGEAAPAPRPARRAAPASRHGAITRELTRFASYQLWAEKVRVAWQADENPEPPAGATDAPRR